MAVLGQTANKCLKHQYGHGAKVLNPFFHFAVFSSLTYLTILTFGSLWMKPFLLFVVLVAIRYQFYDKIGLISFVLLDFL